MSTISLAEIVNTACEMKTKEEKVAWLQKHNSKPLRNIMKIMYDKSLKLNIPNSEPPYVASEMPESHGLLYRESRKLQYFVEGFGGDHIKPIRREQLFIQMLESVDKQDSQLLLKMLKQKALTGMTAKVLQEALGDFIPVKSS